MEISKTYSSGSLFFNRIIITPKVSDIFLKSLSCISNDGSISSITSEPIELTRQIVFSNNVKNSIAIEVIVDHPSGQDMDDLLDVNISRIKLQDYGTINTNTVSIPNKGNLYIVSRVENDAGVIISATISIAGYSKDNVKLFAEKVTIGLGNTREILTHKSIYGPGKYRYYKDYILSSDEIKTDDNGVINPDSNSYYIYLPEYLSKNESLYISQDISLDANNVISIKNKDVETLECSASMEILDMLSSDPLIKYFGVMSE